jgi:hypothetical protein
MRAYIRGWVDADADAVAATLAPDCVVIESNGPVYRGTDRVREWMQMWFGRGGRVEAWNVTSMHATPEAAFMEWTFQCWWDNQRWVFDGASLARSGDEGLTYVREYQTTAELYEWNGAWRE